MARASTNRSIRTAFVRRVIPGIESLIFCLSLAFAAALTFGVLG